MLFKINFSICCIDHNSNVLITLQHNDYFFTKFLRLRLELKRVKFEIILNFFDNVDFNVFQIVIDFIKKIDFEIFSVESISNNHVFIQALFDAKNLLFDFFLSFFDKLIDAFKHNNCCTKT